jgi:hypothetical protein
MPDDTKPDETPASAAPEGTTPVAAEPLAAPPPPTTPAPAPTSPVAAAATGPAPRSRRGLVLAGAIVGAVVVLAATFGGGVLVGSAFAGHGGRPAFQQGHQANGYGPRGDFGAPGGQGFRDRQGNGDSNGSPGN